MVLLIKKNQIIPISYFDWETCSLMLKIILSLKVKITLIFFQNLGLTNLKNVKYEKIK